MQQLSVLVELHDDKVWEHDTMKAHKNTLNSLYNKELIKSVNYANGEFWEMTDKGLDIVDFIKNK